MTNEEARKEIIEAGIALGGGDYVDLEALKVAVAALDKQIPKKPIDEADEFGDIYISCPTCLGPVSNYWAPGTVPKHCQFCGQALDWEEAKA